MPTPKQPPTERPRNSEFPALLPETLAFHEQWTSGALEAVKLLMSYDRNHIRFEQRIVASVTQGTSKSGLSSTFLKARLTRNDALHEACEMGCHTAFFIPGEHAHTYKPREPLPQNPPLSWVPLGHTITHNDNALQGEYLITMPNSAVGIANVEGLLVIRPNSSNDVLYRRLALLHSHPNAFPLALAPRMLAFKEDEVRTLGNADVPHLLPEQLDCVRFFQTNPITFIWGPPGTGKSITLTSIIETALAEGQRVLVLATTNDAIDSIAEKLHDVYADGRDEHISAAVHAGRITRYGNTWRTKRYPELAFSLRVARTRSQYPITMRTSMANDRVTLTTLFRFLHQEPVFYDTVIIDEAGAVNVPLLYCAAASAIRRFVVCGDPRQTTPIFKYANVKPPPRDAVKRLFSTDIFVYNGFRLDPGAAADARLCKLKTQFRMVDELASIVRLTALYPEYITADSRKMTPGDRAAISCYPLPGRAFVLVDTSSLDAPINAGNTNAVHAELVKAMASRYMSTPSIGHIGIIAPYRHQASAYAEWVRKGKFHRVTAGTVHRFQGSEAPLIIFDTVESPSATGTACSHAFTDEVKHAALGTINVLNVAVSRARAKLIIVANVDYIRTHLSRNCFLMRVIEYAGSHGLIIPASVVLNTMGLALGRPVDTSAYFSRTPQIVYPSGFNNVFCTDIDAARFSIAIRSKRVSKDFVYALLPWLYERTLKSAIRIDLYIPGNLPREHRNMVEDIASTRPTICLHKQSEWVTHYGHSPFIVFDEGKLTYEASDGGIVDYLAGEVPNTTHRFVHTGLAT